MRDSNKTILLKNKDLENSFHLIHKEYPWVSNVYREFCEKLEDSDFPCIFARSAHYAKSLYFLITGLPDKKEELERVRSGLSEYLSIVKHLQGIQASMNVLIIFFKPQNVSIQKHHKQSWNVIQDWIDKDSKPWPLEIPQDPNQPMWSLCYEGIPLFVNVSCPTHIQRRSRNLGPSLTFVVQPREGFDLVAGNCPKGDAVRDKIRKRMAKYDKQPAPAELGTYHKKDLEWLQYILKETNSPREETCPIKFTKKV